MKSANKSGTTHPSGAGGFLRANIGEIVAELSAIDLIFKKHELFQKFKATSDAANARSTIKLPSESRRDYLKDWGSINSFAKSWTLAVPERAGTPKG